MKQRELMIANELNRAKTWIKKRDFEEVKNCYEDLTIATVRSRNRLKEYLRLREMMGKFYIEKKGNLRFNSQLFACICTMSQ